MLFSFLLVICALLPSVTSQNMSLGLPQCALTCAISTCDAPDQSCICTDQELQGKFAACMMGSCSIKEGLTTQNITATICAWPIRDESLRLKDISVPLLVVATVAVLARLISRMPRYKGPPGMDDYVIAFTWMCLVANTALVWSMSNYGLGEDIWTMPFSWITHILLLFKFYTSVYILTVWLTKISILLLYLRLFPDLDFQRKVKIALGLCCFACFAFSTTCMIECWPISYSWTFWDGEHIGTCSNMAAQGWAHVFVNIIADIGVLVLPIQQVWSLTLPLDKKLGIMAMFSVGTFVTIVSIVRATVLRRLANTTNITWDWNGPGLWSAIEVYVGVVCACMPGLRAFYTQVFPGTTRKEEKARNTRYATGSQPSSHSSATLGSGGSVESESGSGKMNMFRKFRRGKKDYEAKVYMETISEVRLETDEV